jgi:CBS domain-containing protein
MKPPIQTPEQLLAYRSLKQLLALRPAAVHAIAATDTVLLALQAMADKGTGFLVVLDEGRLVGVFSERDYARKVELRGQVAKDVLVREVMVEKVISVTPEHTIPQCMSLMLGQSFRHLPVVENGKLIGVVSVRDLLREIAEHHERLIRNMELEKLTMLSSGASSY